MKVLPHGTIVGFTEEGQRVKKGRRLMGGEKEQGRIFQIGNNMTRGGEPWSEEQQVAGDLRPSVRRTAGDWLKKLGHKHGGPGHQAESVRRETEAGLGMFEAVGGGRGPRPEPVW